MKLSTLSAKPQLVEVTIDDEQTIKEYGESITFYTWDRQPMEIFTKMASLDQSNIGTILEIVKTLILDEKGKEIMHDGNMLPTDLLMKAVGKVTDLLGK
jgi:hypothetical protein